ncbi:12864_t:CDS:2 [Funneliformis caledonium]|uniref:12864_t:CDS:1 n=1 Tax=Funneliformis caledonium TaxID=1117310 RepID=A0A9N9N8H1_9GLOM|nr:12864_t:CDS:2 [Funneliformis caledonium]
MLQKLAGINEVYPYLLSHDALRQVIKRVRHIDTHVEPQSLESLVIPEDMKKTLDEPMFPPSLWSVTNNIEYAFPRTQNSVEGWHRRWETLIGRAHVDIFKIIKDIQKEQNQVQLNIKSILRGALRSSQRRQDHEREDRIQKVYNDRENRSLMDIL